MVKPPEPDTNEYTQKLPAAHVGFSMLALAVPGTIAKGVTNIRANAATRTRADVCIRPTLAPPREGRGYELTGAPRATLILISAIPRGRGTCPASSRWRWRTASRSSP